jgi:hypothetical protein
VKILNEFMLQALEYAWKIASKNDPDLFIRTGFLWKIIPEHAIMTREHRVNLLNAPLYNHITASIYTVSLNLNIPGHNSHDIYSYASQKCNYRDSTYGSTI